MVLAEDEKSSQGTEPSPEPADPVPPLPDPDVKPDTLEEEKREEGPHLHGD